MRWGGSGSSLILLRRATPICLLIANRHKCCRENTPKKLKQRSIIKHGVLQKRYYIKLCMSNTLQFFITHIIKQFNFDEYTINGVLII